MKLTNSFGCPTSLDGICDLRLHSPAMRLSRETYDKVGNNNLKTSNCVALGRNAIVSNGQITAETSHLQRGAMCSILETITPAT
jgi:hypothetical protein